MPMKYTLLLYLGKIEMLAIVIKYKSDKYVSIQKNLECQHTKQKKVACGQ